MSEPKPRLHGRAATVFENYFGSRAHQLHPEDREAADAFWDMLGNLDRPATSDVPAWRQPRPRYRAFAALAAALVLAVLGATFLYPWGMGEIARYHTERGQTSTLALTDGSSVRLGAESSVQIAYEPGVRRVRLEAGEAIFDVARNPDRPFIVETRSGQLKALGTTFMVRLLPDQAQLTVIEGSVKVVPDAEGSTDTAAISRIANTGEQVAFGSVKAVAGAARQAFVGNVGPADVAQATGWTRGMLYFRGETLAEAVSVVNRYAEHPLPQPDPSAADIPFYAAIRPGDTSALAAILEDPNGTGAVTRTVE